MSRQRTNHGPPYPCQSASARTSKPKFACKYYSCWSWVHQRCSGLASPSLHLDLWRCSRYQTPSPSPSKGKPPSPFFPSPILIPPLMGKTFFLPRSLPLTSKGDDPLSLLSPPPLMGRPLLPQRPPFTPEPPLLLHPHYYLFLFHLFFPFPPALTHPSLHY